MLIGAGEGRVADNEASQRGYLHLFVGSCDGPHSGALVPQGLSWSPRVGLAQLRRTRPVSLRAARGDGLPSQPRPLLPPGALPCIPSDLAAAP